MPVPESEVVGDREFLAAGELNVGGEQTEARKGYVREPTTARAAMLPRPLFLTFSVSHFEPWREESPATR